MNGKAWHLAADVGGTNARFAVADTSSNHLPMVRQYSVAEHHTFTEVVLHFLADVRQTGEYKPFPEAACLALACPVDGDIISLTNSEWRVDRKVIGSLLGQAPVQLINDFAAVGHAVTELQAGDWVEVIPGIEDAEGPIVVLGPGTGLGVCTVVPTPGGWRVLAGEGGHVDYAPVDAIEIEVLRALTERFGRVSVERVLSGAGLENIYQVLVALQPPGWGALKVTAKQLGTSPRANAERLSAAEITAAALDETNPLAEEAVQIFCRSLGSHAGNLALTLGAKGGVYIAGGIVPRLRSLFLDSGFRDRYLAKGRFSDYLSAIPVRLITRDNPGLVGAATRLIRSEA